MRNTCYSRREIIDLKGTEEHLKTCGACREIFGQSKEFLKDFSNEVNALGPLMATIEREKNVKSIDEALDAVPENERLAFIKKREGIAPGMVLKLCDRSKKNLLKSPNESERWLRLAGILLEDVKRQRFFVPRDVQWVEARCIGSMGSLAVARGFITKAHEAYQHAQRIFADIGDEFQVALLTLGFSFTLTKMGRALDAKKACLETLAVMRDYGASKEYLHMMINLAMILNSLAQRKRAERILSMLLKALDKDDEYYNLVIHNLALVQMENGQYEKALEFVEKMVEINRAKKMKMEEARAYIIAGEIHILREEFVEAESYLGKAMNLLKGNESPFNSALINVYIAKIQMEVGKREESLQSLREAIFFFSSEGFVPDLIDALELWEKAQKTASNDLAFYAGQAFYKARTFNRLTPETVKPS